MKKISLVLKIVAFGLLIFIWEYAFMNYNSVPEVVPVHFGLSGHPDNFGPKESLWGLAFIAAVLYGILFYASKNTTSKLINLPKNVKEKPEIMGIFLDIMNVIIMAVLASVMYESIAVARGEQRVMSGRSEILLVLLFLLPLSMLLYSLVLPRRKNASSKTS